MCRSVIEFDAHRWKTFGPDRVVGIHPGYSHSNPVFGIEAVIRRQEIKVELDHSVTGDRLRVSPEIAMIRQSQIVIRWLTRLPV
jgi:hypothetical protein